MNAARKVKINLGNESYTIMTDQPDACIYQAGSLVDTLMQELMEKSPTVDSTKVAAMVAFKLATDLVKLQQELLLVAATEKRIVESINQHVSID